MVISHLVVLPDIVGNGHVDVALAVGVIGNPPPGVRIQVQRRGFLPTIAAALPWVHGASIAGRLGRPPRFGQPPIAVAQQHPSQHRQAQVQKRKDKQLVPEDMPSVGFAVPAAGGHPDVEFDGVGRDRLQEVEEVDPQFERRLGRLRLLNVDVAVLPEVGPGQRMRGQEIVKAAGLAQRLRGLEAGLRYGQDPGVFCRGYAAVTLWWLGYPARSPAAEPGSAHVGPRAGASFQLGLRPVFCYLAP